MTAQPVEHQAPAQKLAYGVADIEALTPYGYDRLLAFIASGQLPARRAKGKNGKPGKFVILHRDLEKFLENLDEA